MSISAKTLSLTWYLYRRNAILAFAPVVELESDPDCGPRSIGDLDGAADPFPPGLSENLCASAG